jgi:hypothetical protein
MGGAAFDAVEKVQMTKLDTKSSVCVIETNKTIDGKALQTAVIDYVKKVTNSNPRNLEEVGKATLEISESTMHQIDFSKSIIQKSSFKRVMNLGFQNRTTVLEMETK